MFKKSSPILALLVMFFLGTAFVRMHSSYNSINVVQAEEDEEDEKDEEDEEDEEDERDRDDEKEEKVTRVETVVVTPGKTVIEKQLRTVEMKDSDRDGIIDGEDPHPDVAEIFVVKDENKNGIVDMWDRFSEKIGNK